MPAATAPASTSVDRTLFTGMDPPPSGPSATYPQVQDTGKSRRPATMNSTPATPPASSPAKTPAFSTGMDPPPSGPSGTYPHVG